ncbi:glutamine amidotransferase [Sphingobium sufflavum]|uniref:glutamine amidotransferase n=1 Tax=Sphingobium sufflavum TaxID=1129547 RepID=UPI001F3BEBBD|nr:glutamine amidotransferase [Sphingobium sufflavum]MCE7797188.1 glutamine amidotransferase [Sphingobium sufflavum]
MKSALIIRHVPYEGVAGYRAPIEAAGYDLDRIDVADPAFATLDLREPDLLIMMGGPMGVYEKDRYPWIGCQLKRLAQRLEADRPTIGVCFGAQMVAAALGAEVYAGPHKEVGFHPVELHPDAVATPLRHIADVPVLHWHGDTFTLPEGVELLASSALYAHQAFRRGSNLLALQFHAEMGEDERFHEWVRQWPESVQEAGQDEASFSAIHDELGPGAVAAGRRMIAEWLEGLR